MRTLPASFFRCLRSGSDAATSKRTISRPHPGIYAECGAFVVTLESHRSEKHLRCSSYSALEIGSARASSCAERQGMEIRDGLRSQPLRAIQSRKPAAHSSVSCIRVLLPSHSQISKLGERVCNALIHFRANRTRASSRRSLTLSVHNAAEECPSSNAKVDAAGIGSPNGNGRIRWRTTLARVPYAAAPVTRADSPPDEARSIILKNSW